MQQKRCHPDQIIPLPAPWCLLSSPILRTDRRTHTLVTAWTAQISPQPCKIMILSASLRLATPRAWARRDGHPHTPPRQPQGTGGIFAFPSLSGEGRQNPVCSCKFFLPVQQKMGDEQPLLCNLSLHLLGIRYTYNITYNIYQCEHEYIVLKKKQRF